MTNPNIQQARAWAEGVAKIEDLHPNPRAAVGVIQSLPDHWIDAEKVAELANDMANWSLPDMPSTAEIDCRRLIEIMGGFADRINDLLTPPLPTLADMTLEEREACLWMQVYLPHHLPGAVLTDPGGHGLEPRVMYQDGATFTVEPKDVTPLPGEPKLEWPGGGTDGETTPPHPEDLPQLGEAWMVDYGDGQTVAILGKANPTDDEPTWFTDDGAGYSFDWAKPVSRLVPEVEL